MDMKITAAVIILGILVVVSIMQTLQLADIKGRVSATGLAIGAGSSGTGQIDTSGWTENEKMNYEMHGTIPARISQSGASSGGGMVGGC